MLVSDLIINVRQRIADPDSIEYPDSELIGYLNDCTMALSYELIAIEDSEMIGDMAITTISTTKPTDFLKFTALYPITISGNTISAYGKIPFQARYFKKPKLVSITTESMPFSNDSYNYILEQIVAMAALNRNEYDTSQEKVLIDEIRKLILQVR